MAFIAPVRGTPTIFLLYDEKNGQSTIADSVNLLVLE